VVSRTRFADYTLTADPVIPGFGIPVVDLLPV